MTIVRQHANDDNAGQYVAVQVGRPQISDASMQAFCVDEQTEVLTQRGWITHHSLKAGDPALSVDPQTREIRWEPVVWTHRLEYAGPVPCQNSHNGSELVFSVLVRPLSDTR